MILTTFESSIIFGGSLGSIENSLKPKTKPPSGNLAFPKSVKCSIRHFIDNTFFIFYKHSSLTSKIGGKRKQSLIELTHSQVDGKIVS